MSETVVKLAPATADGLPAGRCPSGAAPVQRGFGCLPCPRCASEAAIAVYLDDLTSLRCADCEETFDLADVRALVEKWAPVLRWLDSAPAAE